jgi:hypothetical protein
MQTTSLNASGLTTPMYVMDVGTTLMLGLMQEIGTGVLNIKVQTDSGNATKR